MDICKPAGTARSPSDAARDPGSQAQKLLAATQHSAGYAHWKPDKKQQAASSSPLLPDKDAPALRQCEDRAPLSQRPHNQQESRNVPHGLPQNAATGTSTKAASVTAASGTGTDASAVTGHPLLHPSQATPQEVTLSPATHSLSAGNGMTQGLLAEAPAMPELGTEPAPNLYQEPAPGPTQETAVPDSLAGPPGFELGYSSSTARASALLPLCGSPGTGILMTEPNSAPSGFDVAADKRFTEQRASPSPAAEAVWTCPVPRYERAPCR